MNGCNRCIYRVRLYGETRPEVLVKSGGIAACIEMLRNAELPEQWVIAAISLPGFTHPAAVVYISPEGLPCVVFDGFKEVGFCDEI